MGENTPGNEHNAVLQMIGRMNSLYMKQAHHDGLIKYKEHFGREMPAHQIIAKMRPDAVYPGDRLRTLHKIQEELKRQPNALWTSWHPVWGLQDIGWVTTRQVMDLLTHIDMDKMLKKFESKADASGSFEVDKVPEQ
jgi:hypothetical protein